MLAYVQGSPDLFYERNAIVPWEEYKKIAGSCATVDLYFESALTDSQKEQILNTFYSHFPGELIDSPTPSARGNLMETYLFLSLVMLGIGLSLVNVFSFYKYWTDYNAKKYYTYMICGCTNIWLYSHIVIQAIVIASLSFGCFLQALFPCVCKLPLQQPRQGIYA